MEGWRGEVKEGYRDGGMDEAICLGWKHCVEYSNQVWD